jgi:tetratricopeptide (TPR) repeat protein
MASAGQGKDEETIAAYREAVLRDTSLSDPYNQLGVLHMKRQEYATAADMFEKYLQGDGGSSISAHLNAGACYLAIAQASPMRDSLLNRARTLLVAARSLNPENMAIRFRLAQYYAFADSFDLAQQQYREVLDLAAADPGKHHRETGEAWAQIAFGHVVRKEYPEAIRCFPKAVAAGYEHANLYLQWGLAVLQTIAQGTSVSESRSIAAESARLFRRAIRLDDRTAQAHFWLGESLIRQRIEGENSLNRKLTKEACGAFKRALALDPSYEDAKKEIFRYGCK